MAIDKEYSGKEYQKLPTTMVEMLAPMWKFGNITPNIKTYFPDHMNGVTEIVDVLESITFNKGQPDEFTVDCTNEELMKKLITSGMDSRNFSDAGIVIEHRFPDGKPDPEADHKYVLNNVSDFINCLWSYVFIYTKDNQQTNWKDHAKLKKFLEDSSLSMQKKCSRDLGFWSIDFYRTFEQIKKQFSKDNKDPSFEIKNK